MSRRFPALVAVASLMVTSAVVALALDPAAAAPQERWHREVGGTRFHWSSPVIADVNSDGSNDVVAAATNGVVYVYNANGGDMWQRNVGAAIASSPAVGDVDDDGANEVVVGFGDLEFSPNAGGVAIINRDGGLRCAFQTDKRYGAGGAAVFNSPAIGDVDGDGKNDIVVGSFDHRIYVINGGCGVIASFDNTDSVWSAPALRDVDGDRQQEIFIGGDATASNVGLPHSGGYYRSLEYNGTGTLHQRWVRLSSETFQSNSAFAVLNGQLAVVTGTGTDYCRRLDANRCPESRKVWAFDPNTGNDIAGWPKLASYSTFLAGPAIGDINGDGKDDVVVGSTLYRNNGIHGGAVDAFLSSNNYNDAWSWKAPGTEEIVSPPVIADVNGSGNPEVLVGYYEMVALDGATGNRNNAASGFAVGNWAHKNAAAVGNLGGTWSVVSAGFDPANVAKIGAFSIPAPTSTPWPMFQKNARRLGGDPTDSGPIRCSQGYWLTGADGGIFAYGVEAPFYGSTGNIRLNAPIVGMTGREDRTGYWFVATDGGIFNYGNAAFRGSTGNIRLNQPIVGMAARPQGDGYWLVARDGGIFNFGGAGFHGSAGNIPLNSPIVGMAATPSGNGYWLVAADGGIFNYGDAAFRGSTGNIRLNQPIVGMAASRGGGYWLVARDGGIFNFGGAPFHGSTGNIRLNQPIVGMRPTPSGNGYWFVATDGGIFAFGDAEFCGSMGNRHLNQPVVGMG